MKFQKRNNKVWRNKRYITVVTQICRCWENPLVQMLKRYFKINDNDRKKKTKNITLVDSYLRISFF